jgi:hypothetical protein
MNIQSSLIVRLADEKNRDQIFAVFGNAGGVYRLFAQKDNHPYPIPRLLETDLEGTLYLGKANSFVKRVIDLKKSLLPEYRSETHNAGKRYKKLTPLQNKFPVSDLMVHLTKDNDPAEREKQEIESYINKFGEVPPLNAI